MASARKEFRFSGFLSVEQEAKLRVALPDWEVQGGRGMLNQHACLAVERAICEQVAIESLGGRDLTIVDVGGNPKRHLHARPERRIHSCCPILDSADSCRVARYKRCAELNGPGRVRNTTYCNHTVQSCDCVAPDAYLLVHSAYYFTPSDFVELVFRSRRGSVVAVVHPFDDAYGVFYPGEKGGKPEAVYRHTSPGRVYVTAQGANNAYEQSDLGWLRGSYYESGDRAIAWELLREVGHSRIYSFCKSETGLTPVPPPESLLYQISNHGYYGELSVGPECRAMVPQREINSSFIRLWSVGSTVLSLEREGEVLYIPKALIGIAAQHASGLPRNAQSFKSVRGKVLTESKNYVLDVVTRPKVAFRAAAIGFVLDVQTEMEIMSSVVGPVSAKFGLHTSMLDFVFPRRMRMWKYALGGFLTTISILAAHPHLRRWSSAYKMSCLAVKHVVWPVTKVLWRRVLRAVVLSSIGVGASAATVYVASGFTVPDKPNDEQKAITWYEETKLYGRSVPLAANWAPLPHPVLFDAVQMEPLNVPVREGAGIEEPKEPRGRERLVDAGGQAVGLLYAGNLPFVVADTAENAGIAVRERAIQVVPEPVALDWAPVAAFAKRIFLTERGLLEFPRHVEPTSFEDWNKRFPKGRQKQHVQALERIRENGKVAARDLKRKAFVKREAQFGRNDEGVDRAAPRLIQGVGDEANVVLGPYMHSYGGKMAKVLGVREDGSFAPAVYAGKMTVEQIGAWADYVDSRPLANSRALWFEDDFSRFDSTISKYALEVEADLYEWMGLKGKAKRVFEHQMKTLGYTNWGHKYWVDATRKSGDPNTSCGNSYLNALVHLYFCMRVVSRATKGYPDELSACTEDQLKFLASRVDMILMGDDNVFVIHYPDPNGRLDCRAQAAEILDDVKSFMTSLGFKAKPVWREYLNDVTFCSARFWHTAEGRVLAPKIGRISCKMGFSVQKRENAAAHAKGVALGLKRGAGFLPVVGDIINRTLKLTERVDATVVKPYFECEATHKSTDGTLAMFQRIYGLTEADLLDFHNVLESIDRLPAIVDHYVLKRVAEVDCD